ncbi:MAG: type II toxin-antitoxin system HipA family toxin [Shewanellaceae bacterium]|nr:type II toxin-antitoxin system HipA family toxin [Shewanellaceae bacterium]
MKWLQSVNEIKVSLDFGQEVVEVGKLALKERQIYFEYDTSFILRGLEISPLKMPLKRGLYQFKTSFFENLPGVFNDSLPDGWGRLLFDRFARTHGVLPQEITPLDRLAHIGEQGLGALRYVPDHSLKEPSQVIQLERLAQQAHDVLSGTADDVLAELIALNGSSAGARPKALVGIHQQEDQILHSTQDLPEGYTPWMVKFSNTQDGVDAGAIEYVYALMAKQAGIAMPEVRLFTTNKSPGYFAIQRFDCIDDHRYHMHTACGLLHTDFRTPALDYEDLINLTSILTKDIHEVEKMYRLAVFNVLAHNRDDHAKNFSYLMDRHGRWMLSPAYDLTFSSGPGGEQSTLVMGEGKHPNIKCLLQLAQGAEIAEAKAKNIIQATQHSLNQWPCLAKQFGVAPSNIDLIQTKISAAWA